MRFSASMPASSGDIPWRMFSTIVCAPATLMFSSPLPVAPAEPTSWSVWQPAGATGRSEEHTSELQSHSDLVCRLLLEKKKKTDKRRKAREVFMTHPARTQKK